jgi:hypothetical protein
MSKNPKCMTPDAKNPKCMTPDAPVMYIDI